MFRPSGGCKLIMEVLQLKENIDTELLVAQKFSEGMTYGEFRNLLSDLSAKGMTSGIEQKESLINYTELNNKRLKRWDKTFNISEKAGKKINEVRRRINWLVLTESWCGDAAPTMPVMNKIAELNPNIRLRILLRDEHPDLMERFRTEGALSIPKLISTEVASGHILGQWGPRPSSATKLVADYKKRNGSLTAEFAEDLQRWYNMDKGKNTMDDLLDLLTLKDIGNRANL
ncbi:MAG: thioredoxin family protein [Flavobacteriaceae bacterium]